MVLKVSIVLQRRAIGVLVLPLFLLAYNAVIVVVVEGALVTPEDSQRFAEVGHPMFLRDPLDSEEHRRNEHDRLMQQGQWQQTLQGDACTQRIVAVKESEYDVDFKDGDFQIGVTPIYRPDDLNGDMIGRWWWDWAVFRGTEYQRSYGTMMIEYSNHRESLTFGFSVTQSYYPINGGCVL
jgi:hypothetical protein